MTTSSERADVVSDVLDAVKLKGAFYFNGEFSAPWRVRTPASPVLAGYLGQKSKVIVFHLLTEGRGVAELEGGSPIPLTAGDVVVFPHGDAHVVGNGAPIKPVDYDRELHRILAQSLRVARAGGGGEVTKFVCGYLSCDPHMGRVLLGCLPGMFKINIRGEGAGQWIENAIRFSVGEAHTSPVGGEAVLARLAEALFIETLRRYLLTLPEEQTGWLAGIRDRHVGRALSLLHGSPARDWTIAKLAREIGLSRSALNDKFRHLLDQSPMAYLTTWRLHLAARHLQASNRTVADIAAEVGYESEPAFNRAFRREFGSPPGHFRKASREIAD
jgi:AraC-like DNA-binding protein